MQLRDYLTVETYQALLARVLLFVPQVVTGILIFLLFWGGSWFVGRIIRRVGTVAKLDVGLIELLARIAKILILSCGAMTALGTLGVDVTALVTGLGLTGFALGFALKDIIANALSGILILIYEPFLRGDTINVTGFEGTVLDINLRYTVLENDGKKTFVPNSNLFTNPVVVTRRA